MSSAAASSSPFQFVSAHETNTNSPALPFTDEVAKLLNFGDSPSHLDFWTYSIQGDYVVVNCKIEKASDLFNLESSSLTLENKRAIIESSSTVIHIHSWSVVRRGLVECATSYEDSIREECFVVNDYRDGIVKTLSTLNTVANGNAHVSFHPKYEGVIVYIWKHEGEVFFSTKKKIDARNSRHGNSRLLSELYDSLRGPSAGQLFPDHSELSGEDVMYVFTVVHPSLFVVSKADVGEGFVIFNGAYCSRSGRELYIRSSSRVKWNYRVANIGEDYSSFGESVVVDSSIQPVLYSSSLTDGLAVPMDDGSPFHEQLGDLISEELEKSLEREAICIENGVWCPFPPPSKFSRPLPPKGDADEIASKALGPYSKKVKLPEDFDEDFLPPVYTWFSFDGAGEASNYLQSGMYSPIVEGVINKGRIDIASIESVKFTPFSPGEPVVVKITDKTTGIPAFYPVQPFCYDWKTRVAGPIPNPIFRAGELRTISNMAAEFQIANENGEFSQTQHQIPEFFSLFREGIPILFRKSLSRIEFLLSRMAEISQTGTILFSIPSSVVDEMEKSLESEFSLLTMNEANEHQVVSAEGRSHFTRRIYFAWACLVLGLVSSPQNQFIAFNAYKEMVEMERKVVKYLSTVYRPLVSHYLEQARQTRTSKLSGAATRFDRNIPPTNPSPSSHSRQPPHTQLFVSSVFSGFNRHEFKRKDGSFNMKLIDEIRNLVFQIRAVVCERQKTTNTDEETLLRQEISSCARNIEGDRFYTIFKTVKSIVH